MHPALRKGPLSLQKHPPPCSTFTKKTHFPFLQKTTPFSTFLQKHPLHFISCLRAYYIVNCCRREYMPTLCLFAISSRVLLCALIAQCVVCCCIFCRRCFLDEMFRCGVFCDTTLVYCFAVLFLTSLVEFFLVNVMGTQLQDGAKIWTIVSRKGYGYFTE